MDRAIDISRSQWGDDTFLARYKHFVRLTDPRNCLKTNIQLEEARHIVQKFKKDGVLPTGGTDALWNAKYVHDSAFHPETGDKQTLMGRMSFQVPGGMVLTGMLLAFYRKPLEIFVAQWLTQSFNAMVNYTNRSGDKPLSTNVILSAYVTATSLATATSIGLNKLTARAPPLVGRFIPFVAVAVANMVNIPCMRSQEMIDGVVVVDEEGNKLGTSTVAAKKAIASVTFSRCCMATPMLITPVVMQWVERNVSFMKTAGKIKSCAVQTVIAGLFMLPAIPAGCAFFTQQQGISVDKLEDDLRAKILERDSSIKTVYYNKGL